MEIKPPAIPNSFEALELLPQSVLVELVLQQQQVIEQLIGEVERLKSLLNKDSQTSSKPPSSDLIRRSEKKPSKESDSQKRKPGGQPGHKGKTRKGFGRVDRYVVVEPQSCPICQGNQWESRDCSTRSYVVAQLVEHPIEIVEYQQRRRICNHCGTLVGGELPENVIAGQDLSANLQAMLVWLGHYGHLSYQKQQEWLQEFGNIEVSLGTLEATTRRVASAVTPHVSELKEWVKNQTHVHVDESPWLVNGVKEWMWVLSGYGYSLFHAGDTRSRAELEYLLGQSFAGVLSSDDFSVYNGYKVAAQQKCLAHLRRHFQQVARLKQPHQQGLGQAFIELIDEAFAQHRQWRETGEASVYASWAESFKGRVTEAIESWSSRAGHAAGLLLKSLRHKSEQWWYFLDYPQVPPDNNRAERSLRLAVTKRKVAGGSRSWNGFERSATLLSVIQSCRAQGRNTIKFLSQAVSLAVRQRSHELSLIPLLK
ncbi:MAG: IS66 family transposase [Moorea sp. SIO4G2]|uniref:IS66 family transposase n=2 Tax=unclassified Moorena TaxID=2683338 RepID=UPI0013F7DEDD|nr:MULTISPECIES: IS66 family transposase [unclassified Moorena]NEO65760.1 IS66 family transposase [Moorena sp. SIO4G2]NEP28992.1 IS66 family transposase [Moorena sp. SIO3I6]NEQ62304.1 IS66 family transposase [Moorena sp. SIO4A1]